VAHAASQSGSDRRNAGLSCYFRFLQISRFEGLDAHHGCLESLEQKAAQLEQTRLELARTLQELKSRPLVWMLRRLRQG
jgi:hypothetical protein